MYSAKEKQPADDGMGMTTQHTTESTKSANHYATTSRTGGIEVGTTWYIPDGDGGTFSIESASDGALVFRWTLCDEHEGLEVTATLRELAELRRRINDAIADGSDVRVAFGELALYPGDPDGCDYALRVERLIEGVQEDHQPVHITGITWADVTRDEYQAWGTVHLMLSNGEMVPVGVTVGVVDSEVASVDAARCGVVRSQCTAWHTDSSDLDAASVVDGLDLSLVRAELVGAAWDLWTSATQLSMG